jgi:hypothetical protein
VLCVEDATAADRRRAVRHCDALLGDIERTDAVPRALTERLLPPGYRACVAVIEQLCDQTPGPRAASEVNRVAR